LVLVILAGVWMAVLLPPWLQNRRAGRPADSISSFRRQLSVLERSNSASVAYRPRPTAARLARMQSIERGPAPSFRRGPVSLSRSAARRRRRDVLSTLVAAALLTLGLAVVLGGPVVVLHLVIDLLMVTYIVLLVRAERLAAEREHKVRFLPQQGPKPALLYRRSAN
jgi:hypothetical protein